MIQVSTASGIPIYVQIVQQVKLLLAAGRLGPGDELPPIRTMAEQLRVNPNTVARAYLELEREGIVKKFHGSGTYISAEAPRLPRGDRLALLSERIDALLVEARHLDIKLDHLLKAIRERHDRHLQSTEKK